MVTDVTFRLLGMKLRALQTLKRAAKSAFIFVLERGAPLHRALAGPSNPAGSGRRQRVAVVCWRKQIRRLQRTPTLPPCWTGRGSFGAQVLVTGWTADEWASSLSSGGAGAAPACALAGAFAKASAQARSGELRRIFCSNEGWANLFKNFIYRDVAFILGRSIVLATVAHYFGPFHLKDLRESLPAPSIILFAALAYVVGYGVQDLGGVLRISSTAIPYQPCRFGQRLYRCFTRMEWLDVDYGVSNAVEFEVEMGRQDIPPRTLQALDRIVSLKVVSMCVGASSIASAVVIAIYIGIYWFASKRPPVCLDATAFFRGVLVRHCAYLFGAIKSDAGNAVLSSDETAKIPTRLSNAARLIFQVDLKRTGLSPTM